MESFPDILVEELSKTYGLRKKIKALESVSFAVEHGTCTALVGPNGAGKTTLLKIVSGIIGKYEGHVTTRGKISISPEISVNFPYMDATENLQYFTRISGNRENPSAILKEMNLIPSGQLAYSFSKGMKRKLDVARSLSVGAEVILMDEPFDGLDPGASLDLARTVNSLKRRGVTFLISSHDLLRLNDIADRVVFLREGKLAGLRDMSSGNALVVMIKGDVEYAIEILREMKCRIISAHNDELHIKRPTDTVVWDILRKLLDAGVKVTGLSDETLDSDYRRIFFGDTN